jgi:hypothetical protein
MASTRERPRSEISFRDEVIRVSCLNELSLFHGRYGLCLCRFGIVPVVSALIHGINEWPKSREMPRMREMLRSAPYGSDDGRPNHDLCLIPVSLLDNILRPLVMARGLDALMLIILIGALGGTVSYGITGLFLGLGCRNCIVTWQFLLHCSRRLQHLSESAFTKRR